MICVCGKCGDNNTKAEVEINFKDKSIYYYCEKCGNKNVLSCSKEEHIPIPKVRIRR